MPAASCQPAAGWSADAEALRACFRGTRSALECSADPSLIPAAVLVPLMHHPDGLQLLLTQRTAHLHDHPGQIAFPGGRVDAADSDVVATALREAEEEVGLPGSHVEVLGHLPEHLTGTGFRVYPVVALVEPGFEPVLDSFEVAELFEVPLGFLLDPANHQIHQAALRGGLREYWAMPYGSRYIWGATAGMIVSLHRHLLQRTCR